MRQIKHWTVANGGAPAVVILGLGLIAVFPLLGTILIVLGSVWFIVRLDPVRKWLIGLLGGDPDLPPNAVDTGGFTITHAGEVHIHAQGQPQDVTGLPTGPRQEIRLADLVNERAFIIRDKTYEDVEFVGPAVIALRKTTVEEPHIAGTIDAAFWRVPDEKEVLGVVAFENCVLRRCRFFAIGFAIPESQWAEIEANTTVHDGPMPAA